MVVDIVCPEMKLLTGLNRVTEKLIFGFQESKVIELRFLHTNIETIDCKNYVSELGTSPLNQGNSKKRLLINKAKRMRLYKSYFVQKIIQNHRFRQNKKCAYRAAQYSKNVDVVIFQDFYSAYYFLSKNKNGKAKTLFITHAETDQFEQLLLNRPSLKNTKTEKKYRKIYEYVIKNVDKVISICSASYNYLLKEYGVESSCILNGIEDVDDAFIRRFHKKDVINVAILGSVTLRKGHDLMVSAFKILDDSYKQHLKVHVIGDGEDFDKIRGMVTGNQLESYFIFYGAQKDVTKILSQMDVMFLPSRSDTVPIAIIEGLRSGLPIFASSVGEIPLMIDGAGVLIRADEQGVKEAYEYCVDNQNQLEHFSLTARNKYISMFALQKMISQYESLILGLYDKNQ